MLNTDHFQDHSMRRLTSFTFQTIDGFCKGADKDIS